MGVRGLTTYINTNQDAFLKHHLLHDSQLIVDGYSLCAQLYRLLNCFSAFGGDYDKYAAYTKNFFKNLRKCNITPYVIFDGSYERRKLKTAYNRLRSKIYGASKLDVVTQGSIQIFPLLLRDTFKEILIEMMIPYTVCDFEADDEIAAMARYLNCPVLSYDSDFFIYNVLYIPFNMLELKPIPIDNNGTRIYVLECKIYKVDYLTKYFGGLKEDMLPLLATLLGNDYVEKRVFKKFFSQLKLPKSKKQKNEQQRCINGLFKWLQNESLDSAIVKILGRLKKRQKDKVSAIIKKSIEGYNKKHCNSLKYFNICDEINTLKLDSSVPQIVIDESTDDDQNNDDLSAEGSSSDDSDITSDEESSDDNRLPHWFVDGIRKNHIPSIYSNLYTNHLYFCFPQAEDYSDDDSSISTLPLLRYAFDILTDYQYEHFIYVSRDKDCHYQKLIIDQEYSIQRPLQIPFCSLSKEQLKLYFDNLIKEKLLNLDLSVIYLLPTNFQLYMLALLWWVTYCNVPSAHIYSLLLCYTMLEVVDERTGTFRGHNFFNNKYSKKVQELKKRPVATDIDELLLNKNKVSYEDCLIAASVLLKHFELDDSIKKKPKSYDVKRMHFFAQFQCCLHQFNCLNTLCGNPYQSTKYSKSYNGTFVYNIALKLENQEDCISFVKQYLKGSNTVLRFFISLCTVYEKCADKMCLTTAKWTGKKCRRRKCKPMKDQISFLVQGFESDIVI